MQVGSVGSFSRVMETQMKTDVPMKSKIEEPVQKEPVKQISEASINGKGANFDIRV